MDWIKARGGWPNWRQQLKKVVVAIAMLAAAGALYLQLKKDYGLNDHINAELQRDYGVNTRFNDPEMLKDYNNFDRVYQTRNVDNVHRDDYGDNSTRLDRKYRAFNTTAKEIFISSPQAQESIIIKDANVQNDQVMHAHDGKHDNTHDYSTPMGFSVAPSLSTSPSTVKENHDGDLNNKMAPSPTPSFSMVKNQNALDYSSINESSIDSKDANKDSSTSSSTSVTIDFMNVSSNSQTFDEKNNFTEGFIRREHMDSREKPGSNQKDLHSSYARSKVPLWPLSKLELELFAAKEAIQNVPPSNSSLYMELHAPIYHNLSQFIKSYELMEKMFRVYVYKEGRGPLVHTGPVFGIYSSEGLFIRQMEQSEQFRTEAVDEALALFLPYSVANMVDTLYVPHTTSMLPLSSFIKSYVNDVAALHPFWNRTRGGDHFFVSCHDWGLMTTYEHLELRHNAIKVLCNADETTEFEKARDKSLPEFYMHETNKVGEGGTNEEGGRQRGRQHQPPRDMLAFFAGQMHGRVRPKLLEYWEYPKGGKEMQVYGVLSATEVRRMSYKRRMHTSRYCLCPMGYEVNSPRLMEAIEAMCVPVIIAYGFVLPFSHVLNWSSFSVTILEKDIPSLKSILQGIPEHAYMTMQSRLSYVHRHFTWHKNPKPFDTFHMILHSVWTSRLTNITSLQI